MCQVDKKRKDVIHQFTCSTANDVNDIIKNEHVRNMVDIEYEGLKVEPPKQIPW